MVKGFCLLPCSLAAYRSADVPVTELFIPATQVASLIPGEANLCVFACGQRIQTWFPFNIQVGLNGREWLARQMDREGLKYVQQGNCFVWIEDYRRAQELMNRQLEMKWAELLNGFAAQLNPEHESIFRRYPTSYYWTCAQSEWATDVVFGKADCLKRLMSPLVRHCVLSFSSADVMRYFGRKVNLSGQIPARFSGTLKKIFSGDRCAKG